MAIKTNKPREKSPAVVVLDIIILILAVFVVLAGVGAVTEFADSHYYNVTAESFLWRLEDEDYGGILRLYYNDDRMTKDKDEYYAIAEYTEAATFYYAFRKTGDSVRARKYLERMEQAVDRMGEFRFVQDKIDAKLTQ